MPGNALPRLSLAADGTLVQALRNLLRNTGDEGTEAFGAARWRAPMPGGRGDRALLAGIKVAICGAASGLSPGPVFGDVPERELR